MRSSGRYGSSISVSVIFILAVFPGTAPADILDNTLETGENLFAETPLLIMGSGAAGALAVSFSEKNGSPGDFLSGRVFSSLDRADNFLFGPYLPVSVGGVWLTGILSGSESTEHTGEDLLRGLFYSYGITGGLKYAFQRERPDGSNDFSFPSNHASSASCIAAVLWADHGPAAGIPAAVIALYTCFSRVNLQRHYASDVIMGAAIGTACGIAAADIFQNEGEQQGPVFSFSITVDSEGRMFSSLW